MSKLFNFLHRNLTKILWTAAILVWVGVGIYYFSTKSPRAPSSIGTSPTPQKTYREPLPDSHYFPSDEEIVEGIVVNHDNNQMTIDANGQLLTFYYQEDSFLAASEEDEEVTTLEGKKMRVYYEERDGKFYLVFGEFLK